MAKKIDPGRFGSEAGAVSAGSDLADLVDVGAEGSSRAPEGRTDPEAPDRQRLFGPTFATRLWVSRTARGWELPVDGLVVPAHPGLDLSGGLAGALRSTDPDAWSAIESELRGRLESEPLRPEEPVFVRSPDGSRLPRLLIFATAWETPDESGSKARSTSGEATGTTASTTGIGRAVRAALRTCRVHGITRLGVPLLGAGSGGVPPTAAVHALISAAVASLPGSALDELTFVVPDEEAYNELLGLFQRLPQRFANDLAQGEDLLDVAGEVEALTDVLLLRDLEPPMTVGILGGWGSGKSFAFHLMKRHLRRLRSRPVDLASAWSEESSDPYVGHVYPITFDAWTYAKSNLWASLMQTIFLELSRQVTLEKRIRAALQGKGSEDLDPEREGRLWAAFQELDEADRDAVLDLPGLAERFAELAADRSMLDTDAGRVLWETVASVKEEQRKILDEKRAARETVETKIEQERAQVSRQVEADIRDEAYRSAWSETGSALQTLIEEQVGGSDDGWRQLEEFHRAGAGEIKNWARRWKSLWRSAREAPWLTAAVVLGVAILMLVTVFLAVSGETLASLAPALTAIATPLVAAERASRSFRRRLGAAWDGLDRRLRVAEERLDDERRRRLDERLENPRGELRALETERRELESEIDWLEKQIGFTARYVSVADLVGARLETADYEGELGLMHRVQRDLDELSQALTRAADHPHRAGLERDFPRGPARVVLFIDDLDRCPPDRVVEVLEAAQLLVKTRLFVVVVALDQRYVTRALERVYRGVLRRGGAPCGLDYVEKIIQLPYSIRPIDPASLERFLRGQMDVAVETRESSGVAPAVGAEGTAPSGSAPTESRSELSDTGAPLPPEVLTFDSEELGWLRDAAARVAISPRALKRVINAFKLLKIVWYRPSRHPRPGREVQHAFVVILVLSAAFPTVFRRLFASFSTALTAPNGSVDLEKHARAVLQKGVPATEQAEADALLDCLELIPTEGAVPSSSRSTLELVRSLSFVVDL